MIQLLLSVNHRKIIMALLSFNVTIIANSTTNDCNDSCCTNITIFIQLVLNTSDPQYANLSYNISYDSITVNEESMVTSDGEWNKNIQLPCNRTHYFDSRQAKNQCSSSPMPENSGTLSAGDIAVIILAVILAPSLIANIGCFICWLYKVLNLHQEDEGRQE
uniref:Uncharacterized protein n=1 Tax=Amphimedon queenslandica TaxID=400682 RepID=A0A1X7SZH3_AMPQE